LSIFGSVVGVGSGVNIVYIMIEHRVPVQKLGASIVLVISASIFVSTFAPYAAFAQEPVPFILGITVCVIGIVLAKILPGPKQISK
jgi:predicted tellurium resistance membrane protein TerC